LTASDIGEGYVLHVTAFAPQKCHHTTKTSCSVELELCRSLEVVVVEFKLKTVSKAGIAGAIAKAEMYRYLNEPGETESICRDVLATEPDNQAALRLLGLAIADRFSGGPEDRVAEAESLFQKLTDTYERLYYLNSA